MNIKNVIYILAIIFCINTYGMSSLKSESVRSQRKAYFDTGELKWSIKNGHFFKLLFVSFFLPTFLQKS